MTRAGRFKRYRRWQLARRGLRLDPSCFVHKMVSIAPRTLNVGELKVGAECELCFGVELNPWQGSITIGRDVFLGPHTVIYGRGGGEVGDPLLTFMHLCI